MSTDEIKTRLVLDAEARGFDKVMRIVDDVVGAVEGSSGASPGLMASLDKALAGITASLGKLEDTLGKIAKSAKALDGLGEGGGTPSGATPAPSGRGDPSFTRGALQGLGVGQYLPGESRGALTRQAAGALAGRTVAGVGRGVLGSAFTGTQGLASAFSSIAGIGGAAGGMAQAAIAAVEDALELQRAEREAVPFMNRAAGRRAGAAAAEALWLSEYQPDMVAARARGAGEAAAQAALRGVVGASDAGAVRSWPGAFGVAQASQHLLATGEEPAYMRRARQEAEARVQDETFGRRSTALAQAAGPAYQHAAFGGDVTGAGVRYGLDQIEATRAFAELMRGRGGITVAGALPAALAAQAGLGVDLGTSGTLLRGGRSGALPGMGTDGDRLAQAIGRAVGLGLEGSEITDHLQQVAEGIRAFEATGIPLRPEATDAIAHALMASGMSNAVAAGRSSAFAAAVQGRAREGLPSTAVDFAALVHLGGYTSGGSEDALAARARLARGELQEGGLDALTRTFAGQLGSGPLGRAFGVEMGFRGLGLTLNPDEAASLEARARGQTLSSEQEAQITEIERRFRRGPTTAAELESMAADATPGGLQAQAEIRNRRIAAGTTSLPAVQQFEARAALASEAFAKIIDKAQLLAPVLDALTKSFAGFVERTTGHPVVHSGP